MPLTEFLLQLKGLSYTDKLQLLHFLITELLNEAGVTPLDTQEGVAIPNRENSFEAAAVLAKALAEHQAAKHG
jgi:hypothetical protein